MVQYTLPTYAPAPLSLLSSQMILGALIIDCPDLSCVTYIDEELRDAAGNLPTTTGETLQRMLQKKFPAKNGAISSAQLKGLPHLEYLWSNARTPDLMSKALPFDVLLTHMRDHGIQESGDADHAVFKTNKKEGPSLSSHSHTQEAAQKGLGFQTRIHRMATAFRGQKFALSPEVCDVMIGYLLLEQKTNSKADIDGAALGLAFKQNKAQTACKDEAELLTQLLRDTDSDEAMARVQQAFDPDKRRFDAVKIAHYIVQHGATLTKPYYLLSTISEKLDTERAGKKATLSRKAYEIGRDFSDNAITIEHTSFGEKASRFFKHILNLK